MNALRSFSLFCGHSAAVPDQFYHTASWFAVLLPLLSWGCTTIGMHQPAALSKTEFGPLVSVRLCVLLDEGISRDDAQALLDAAWQEEGRRYNLRFEIVDATEWQRPAFTADGILSALVTVPLSSSCDRLLAFVGRHLGDVVWGLIGPAEVLGAVNDATQTHGYVVARIGSLQQLILTPASALRHELYHLLGCEHFAMVRCYQTIAQLKRDRGISDPDFFPSWSAIEKRSVRSRRDVNALLQQERTALTGMGTLSSSQ